MARNTLAVQPDGYRNVTSEMRHHATFTAVNVTVRDADHNATEVTFFCQNASDLDTLMAALSRLVRDYYADAEPEPDWEAIAAEYDELCRER